MKCDKVFCPSPMLLGVPHLVIMDAQLHNLCSPPCILDRGHQGGRCTTAADLDGHHITPAHTRDMGCDTWTPQQTGQA